MDELEGLNARQKKFIEEYLKNGGNGTRAVLDAGYQMTDKAAAAFATRLLNKDKVSSYVRTKQNESLEKTQKKIQISQDKIAATLVRIAFDGLEDVIEVSEQGDLEIKPEAKLDLIDGVSFSKSESDGKGGYSRSKGFSFKRSDRLKALDMLVKLMGGYEKFAGDSDKESKGLDPERVLKLLKKFGK